MISRIKKLDLFGLTFNFTTFNNVRYQTIIGSILSFLCLSIVVVTTYFFGVDCYYRINPIILTQTVNPVNSTYIHVGSDQLILAYRLEYASGNPRTGPYWMNMRHNNYTLFPNGSYEYEGWNQVIPNVPCSTLNITNQDFLNSVPYQTLKFYSCIDLSKQNFVLGGISTDLLMAYFDFNIDSCPWMLTQTVGSWTPSCLAFDLSTKANYYFSMFLPYYSYQPENLNQPIKISYVNSKYKLNPYLRRNDIISLSTIENNDDQGWLFSSTNITRLLTTSSISSSLVYTPAEDRNTTDYLTSMYNFRIYYSKGVISYKRSYQKLQDLAATVGGIMKIVFVFFELISLPFSYLYRKIEIINELYDFKEKEGKPKSFLTKDMITNRSSILLKKNISHHEEFNKINDVDSKLKSNNYMDPNKLNNSNNASFNLNNSNNHLNQLNSSPVINKLIDKKPKTDININSYKIQVFNSRFYVGMFQVAKFYLYPKSWLSANDLKIYNIYMYTSNNSDEKFDITTYLKALDQIQKMKTLLFNHNQALSFDYQRKPNLLDEDELKALDLRLKMNQTENQTKENEKALVKYFKDTIESEKHEFKDAFLFEFLKNDLKSQVQLSKTTSQAKFQ